MLPLFSLAVYFIAKDRMDAYFRLPLGSLESSARTVGGSFHDLLYRGAAAFFIFGCIMLFRQRMEYAKQNRMSKQEIKDESKDSDGNPQTKQRIRRLQRDNRRRQMMREVPKATAVIVNPTHYAVAIKYSMESMSAPAVVAKEKTTWPSEFARWPSIIRCRSLRILRLRRHCINQPRSGRKFRRTFTAPWRKSWLISTSS